MIYLLMLKAFAVMDGSIYLSWQGNHETYHIYRDGELVATTDKTWYQDIEYDPTVCHYWQVNNETVYDPRCE